MDTAGEPAAAGCACCAGAELPELHASGPLWVTWAALAHAAGGRHRGLLLLMLVQVRRTTEGQYTTA